MDSPTLFLLNTVKKPMQLKLAKTKLYTCIIQSANWLVSLLTERKKT